MSNANYYMCEIETGRITYRMQGNADRIVVPEGCMLVEHEEVNLDDYFYDSEAQALAERMDFPVGVMDSGYFVIDNLPVGTSVVWQNNWYNNDETSLSVLVDQVGSFELTLTHPHYKKKVYTIEN